MPLICLWYCLDKGYSARMLPIFSQGISLPHLHVLLRRYIAPQARILPCVSKQCPADGVWRIGRGGSPDRVLKTRFTPSESSAGHGLPRQRAPKQCPANGVRRIVWGFVARHGLLDTVKKHMALSRGRVHRSRYRITEKPEYPHRKIPGIRWDGLMELEITLGLSPFSRKQSKKNPQKFGEENSGRLPNSGRFSVQHSGRRKHKIRGLLFLSFFQSKLWGSGGWALLGNFK